MKVVFLNHFISGGGAERVTCLLAGKMVEKGHEVLLMTDLFRPFAYLFDEKIRKISLFSSERESKSHVSFIYMVKNTRRMIENERPDVVIGVLPMMNMVAILAARGTKTKVIATHHTSFDRPVGIHIRLIQQYGYKFADAVTILTQADYNYLGSQLPQKVVMPNPLAYKCVNEIGMRKKVILAAGRLDVWKLKGFDLLIHAWSKIASDYPEWDLNIAGEGKNESMIELEKIIYDNNANGRVKFLGRRKDIDVVMRESSIFVLSSRIEGFGMVLIEAMSQGCACISFDDGGRQREIITSDKEGIIIENHDVCALATAIKGLIENEKKRDEIAKAGIKRSLYYSLDNIENRWEILLKKIYK